MRRDRRLRGATIASYAAAEPSTFNRARSGKGGTMSSCLRQKGNMLAVGIFVRIEVTLCHEFSAAYT